MLYSYDKKFTVVDKSSGGLICYTTVTGLQKKNLSCKYTQVKATQSNIIGIKFTKHGQYFKLSFASKNTFKIIILLTNFCKVTVM